MPGRRLISPHALRSLDFPGIGFPFVEDGLEIGIDEIGQAHGSLLRMSVKTWPRKLYIPCGRICPEESKLFIGRRDPVGSGIAS
jgi:hypothetical protein